MSPWPSTDTSVVAGSTGTWTPAGSSRVITHRSISWARSRLTSMPTGRVPVAETLQYPFRTGCSVRRSSDVAIGSRVTPARGGGGGSSSPSGSHAASPSGTSTAPDSSRERRVGRRGGG